MNSRLNSSLTYAALIGLSILSFFARLPSVNLGLPPHIFVDELFFFDDVFLHLKDFFFFPQSFVSGAVNEIPLWVIGRIFYLFDNELSYVAFLQIGRVFLPLFLTSITVFPLYALSLKINKSKKAGFLSVLLFIGSPWVFSNSQIWYPDHYIYFFVCLYLLQIAKFLENRYDSKLPYLIGISFGLLVSVKYTSFFYIVPLLLAIKFLHVSKRESRSFIRKIAFKSMFISSITYLIINYSIFWHFYGFLQGMNSNRKNYRFFTNLPFENLWAYSELLFIFGLGYIGAFLIVLGMCHYRNDKNPFLRILIITVFSYLFVLSTSPIMVPRNINLLIPLISVVGGAGANYLVAISKKKGIYRYFISVTILLLSLMTFKSYFVSFQEVRKPDSYTLVKQYIERNISPEKKIGINPGSDGLHPVQELERNFVSDSMLKLSLEYYVINSYWESPLMPYFHRNGFFQEWSSRNFHFYEGSSKSAFKLLPRSDRLQDYVPEGYIVRAVIKSVGPTFVVLQRSDR